MPELSPEAKAELADAIRIIREDKQFAMLHKLSSGSGTPPKEGTTPPTGNPPPAKEPTVEPPKKAGLWWGDRISE